MAATKHQTKYRVEGMDCASCASKIDTAVRRMPGVEDVNVSVTAGMITVKHALKSDLAAIEKKVTGLGYTVAQIKGKSEPATRAKADEKHTHDHAGHDHEGDDAGTDHQGHDEEVEGLHGHDYTPTSGPWWNSPKGRLTIASGVALVAAFAVHYV
ncbi:hypothetical protein B5V02_24195 [Mesorhizobium kowhaii]|uniref:HMA domain-containing protein n=1 Tax=Mesorhizobium kowhaii TaxID=1300272 RepID=A0A2W7C395_9HYPH|nr:heavy metal-associated domain-containing protein [Mesorhizobium kowhaii]PZV36288.1 hypothetical protein B5V02_24195 [Mesorhizobium kowhaii]